MKTKRFKFLTSSIVFCASSALMMDSSTAAEVSAAASGDWSVGTTWSDGLPAAPGNNYTIDGFTVTSPSTSNTITFAGDALAISNTGATAGVLDLARLHALSNQAITTTLPDITIGDGATLQFRASTGSNTWNVVTATDINTSGTVLINNSGGGYAQSINIGGTLSGSGLIQYKTANSGSSAGVIRTLSLNSAGSTYSGDWFVQHVNSGDDYGALQAGAANALGSGFVTLDTRARLVNNAANGLDSLTGITLNQSTSGLYLNNRDWTSSSGILTVADGTADIGTATVSIASMSETAGTIKLTVGGGTDGKLVLSGDADFIGGSIAVTLASASLGSYDLVSYGGSLVTPPTVSGDFGRLTPSVSNGSGTADKVTLSITGSVGNLTWKGDVDSNWNNNSTANFDNGGSPDVFRNFDNVSFDESATSFAPTLVGTLTAGTVAFSNTTDYSIGGAGSLAGGTTITKSGSGNLTISTANTYTGNVTITGGTLIAGSTTALGASIVGGGTYISGGGTLDINNKNLGAELIAISGTGAGGNGAIVNSGASQTQALRFVNLTGNASVGGLNRWDIRGNGTATLNLAGYKLIKTGANYVGIVATNVTDGDIDVNEGTLAISTTSTVNGAGTITINSGGILEIAYGVSAANVTRDIVLNGGKINAINNTNGANSNIDVTADSEFYITSGQFTLNGNIDLAADLIVSGTYGLIANGNITESDGAHRLIKTGTSTLFPAGTANTWSGGTVIDNGTVQVNADQAMGSGTITIGETDTSAASHALRLNGVTIDNNIESKYMWTADYKGSITAIGGTTSTVNGDITINPSVSTNNRGGHIASDATANSVLKLMGELNVGGGQTVITHRDGAVEYGGGGSTAFNLQVTGTARLVGNDGISTLAYTQLGVSGAATLDLNGFNQKLEGVVKGNSSATITNNGVADSTLTVSPTQDRTYSGSITDGATNKVSVVKGGPFTYTLTGTKTYTGATTVTGGTLAGTGNSASSLIVQTGAAVAPGDGVGTFASETATFQSGSSLVAQLDSSASSADKLDAFGDVTIGTGVTLSLSDIAGTPAVLPLGTELVLIDYTGASLTGTFDGITEGSEITVGLNKFLIAYHNSSRVTLAANGAAGGYDSWSTQITNGKTLRTEDADDDGFTNLQEFLFGTNPMASNGTLVTMTSSGGSMVMRWLQRESGSTYTLQESNSLSGWATLVSPVPAMDGDQSGAPTDYDYYKVTLTSGTGKDFYRIQGVEN